MQAYRIVNWKDKFEVTDKGKAFSPGSADMLKKKPLEYLRMPVSGHNLDPVWRQIVKNAWRPNDIFELAIWGLYEKLCEIAGDQPARYRGWILSCDYKPLTDTQIAELLDIHEVSMVKQAMTALTSSAIGLVALCEIGDVSQSPAVRRGSGENRPSGTLWDDSPKFQTFQKFPNNNITKPNSIELNQTKPNQRAPQQEGESSQLPQEVGSSPPDNDSSAICVADKRRQIHKKLCEILKITTPASQKVLVAILDCIESKVLTDRATEGLYDLAVAEARQCTIAENPMGLFVHKMKKSPFGYDPNRMAFVPARRE